MNRVGLAPAGEPAGDWAGEMRIPGSIGSGPTAAPDCQDGTDSRIGGLPGEITTLGERLLSGEASGLMLRGVGTDSSTLGLMPIIDAVMEWPGVVRAGMGGELERWCKWPAGTGCIDGVVDGEAWELGVDVEGSFGGVAERWYAMSEATGVEREGAKVGVTKDGLIVIPLMKGW